MGVVVPGKLPVQFVGKSKKVTPLKRAVIDEPLPPQLKELAVEEAAEPRV